MISKLITGKSIRGLLRYIFRERENLKGVEFLESNLVGYNLDLLSRQFVQIRMQKPELTTPVTHLVVSFDPRDEGKLTPEMKREVVHRQLRTLGYLGSERGDCPYVVVRHADKRHDHLHVAISQVSFQGVRIDRSNDQYKANELDRKLESEWGLRQCRSHKIKVARRKEIERLDLPEAGQYQIPAPGTLPNPGEISQHEWLRQIIGPVVEDLARQHQSIAELVPRLRECGLELTWKEHSKGLNLGVRIHGGNHDGGYASFSELKQSWSFPNLQKKWGLTWDGAHDLARLKAAPTALTLDGLRNRMQGLSHRVAELRRQLALKIETHFRRSYGSTVRPHDYYPTREGRLCWDAGSSARQHAGVHDSGTVGIRLSPAGSLAQNRLHPEEVQADLGRLGVLGRLVAEGHEPHDPGRIGNRAAVRLGAGISNPVGELAGDRQGHAVEIEAGNIPRPLASHNMGLRLSVARFRERATHGATDAGLHATGGLPSGSDGPGSLVSGDRIQSGSIDSGQYDYRQWAGNSSRRDAGRGSRLGSPEGGGGLDRFAAAGHRQERLRQRGQEGAALLLGLERYWDPTPPSLLAPGLETPYFRPLSGADGILRSVTLADIVEGRAFGRRRPRRLVSSVFTALSSVPSSAHWVAKSPMISPQSPARFASLLAGRPVSMGALALCDPAIRLPGLVLAAPRIRAATKEFYEQVVRPQAARLRENLGNHMQAHPLMGMKPGGVVGSFAALQQGAWAPVVEELLRIGIRRDRIPAVLKGCSLKPEEAWQAIKTAGRLAPSQRTDWQIRALREANWRPWAGEEFEDGELPVLRPGELRLRRGK